MHWFAFKVPFYKVCFPGQDCKMEGISFFQEGSFCWETEATTFNWILGKESVEGLLAASCPMGRLLPSHVTLKYKCLSPASIPKSFVHYTLHSQRLFTFLIFRQTRWNLLLDNHSLLLSLLKLIPANLREHNKNAVFFPLCGSLWMIGRHSLLMCIKRSAVLLSPCQLCISSKWINYTWLVQAESSLWKQAGSFALRTQYLVAIGTEGLMGAFEII